VTLIVLTLINFRQCGMFQVLLLLTFGCGVRYIFFFISMTLTTIVYSDRNVGTIVTCSIFHRFLISPANLVYEYFLSLLVMSF